MGTNPNIPPNHNPPNRNGPLSIDELLVQLSYWIADIHDNLGDSKRAIEVLEHARRTHEERILRLFITTTRTESELAFLRNTVERHTTDLSGLGRRAQSLATLIRVALLILTLFATPTLILIAQHVRLTWKP
jgi:hypothetical protein